VLAIADEVIQRGGISQHKSKCVSGCKHSRSKF
jgi:hypothetical protein